MSERTTLNPSISSVGDSPVPLSRKRPEVGTLVPGGGRTLSESFVHFDLASCSWKTLQGSLIEGGGLEKFSGTWPLAGTMRSGACYRLPLSMPRTTAPVYGWLPTPTATMNQTCESMQKHRGARNWRRLFGSGPIHPATWEWLMGFPPEWTDLSVLATPLSLKSQSG